MNFREDALAAHENSKAHGFHDTITGDFQIPVRLLLIISEISEAFEEYRTHKDLAVMSDEFVEELADVYIRLADLVCFSEIGLDRFEEIVQRKMEKNRTRPHLHGGKRV